MVDANVPTIGLPRRVLETAVVTIGGVRPDAQQTGASCARLAETECPKIRVLGSGRRVAKGKHKYAQAGTKKRVKKTGSHGNPLR